METTENKEVDEEKEKLIHQTVIDLEAEIISALEDNHPDGLDLKEYITCATLSMAYVIEGIANTLTHLKGEPVSFHDVMFTIAFAQNKAKKYRKHREENGNK